MYGVRRKVNKQAITFNLFVSLCVQSLSFIWLFVTPWTTHIRFPCPSLSPGVCSNSCPLTLWCHPTVSSFVAHFFCGQEPTIFPSIRVFSSESAPHIRWSKYWSFSFSISPSHEYSGLISFRIGLVWSPCCPKDSQESSPATQFESISSSMLSLLYDPVFPSVHN